MKNVVNLRSYADVSLIPTLVLLDMQQEYIASPRLYSIPDAETALENCRLALMHSRRTGLPVAFLRMVDRSPFFNPVLSYSSWISGFEPLTSEMVFERSKPSCYANREFAHAMTEGGGHFVLAGFSGEEAAPCDCGRGVSSRSSLHISRGRLGKPRSRPDLGADRSRHRCSIDRSLWRGNHHAELDRRADGQRFLPGGVDEQHNRPQA